MNAAVWGSCPIVALTGAVAATRAARSSGDASVTCPPPRQNSSAASTGGNDASEVAKASVAADSRILRWSSVNDSWTAADSNRTLTLGYSTRLLVIHDPGW